MNHKSFSLTALVLSTACATLANAATTWSTQDYDLYSGDFNGDGKTDILYIAKSASNPSGIAVSDGSGPNTPWQSWAYNYLGIPWYGNAYTVVVGDFNHDGKADLFLQRNTPGDSYLLLATNDGKITAISQTVSAGALGLTWSADQHKIAAGDFDGDGRTDLFLQATSTSGVNAIVLADANGSFTAGPQQTWTDTTWSAFKWSTKNSNIFVGDFNGDGKADLLVQTKASIVMIDYDISIPVPVYKLNTFGNVYSQGAPSLLQQAGVQQWSRNSFGVDWAPTSATPVIGDFNADSRSDVFLQSRNANKPSYLLTGNASGSAFAPSATVSSNVAVSADAARLIAGRFSDIGSGAGLYVQSTTPSGTNYVATTSGSALTASVHDATAAVAAEFIAYAYDAKGRLVKVLHTGVINNNVQTDYTYDKANNRKTVITTGSSNPVP